MLLKKFGGESKVSLKEPKVKHIPVPSGAVPASADGCGEKGGFSESLAPTNGAFSLHFSLRTKPLDFYTLSSSETNKRINQVG